MAAKVPTIKLNDGNLIPAMGYGTGTAWYKSSETGIDRTLVEALKTAIRLGYRHLDGAEVYGTELELGLAIKESGVPRSEFFVTTKVYKSINNIPEAFEASLEKLGLDYVDLYLIHAPFKSPTDKDLQTQWAELEKIHASGKARSIGVSNFLSQHINAILKTAKVVPAINQIEYHPYLQHRSLLALQKEHHIAVAAYGPLAPVTKAQGGPIDEIMKRLSDKYKVGEGEVLLRWVIDQGMVVVTTSGKEERMKEYLRVGEFSLLPEEVKELSEAGETKHFRGFWTAQFKPNDRS